MDRSLRHSHLNEVASGKLVGEAGICAASHVTWRCRAQRQCQATQSEHLVNWACALEPDGERLVAYLERKTPWDS